jgi:hypothetical protein
MKQLDLQIIRSKAPYDVIVAHNGDLLFKTDFDVEYAVSFEEDNNPLFKAYWFNLSNMNHKTSPGDKKIPQTVICIIEEFFRQNPDVLLYMCSNVGGQQAMRARFLCDGSTVTSNKQNMPSKRPMFVAKKAGLNMLHSLCSVAILS